MALSTSPKRASRSASRAAAALKDASEYDKALAGDARSTARRTARRASTAVLAMVGCRG
jgi:hypothetical protein